MKDKIELYFNTVKYLKWKQIVTRILRKIKPTKENSEKKGYIKNMLHLYVEILDADMTYLKRFQVEELMQNKVHLLHETHTINLKDWKLNTATTHLWLFNLQYMEYLIPLAVEYNKTKNYRYYEKIKEIISSWKNCFSEVKGDAWEAYVISLRLPNWLIVMQLIEEELNKDEEFLELLTDSMCRQYEHLKVHTEEHLLGNHYLENLKTLFICSVLFGEVEEENRYRKLLLDEYKEQILSDGMHFELSFMYHKIVAEGLLRVILVMKQKGKQTQDVYEQFVQIFQRMCDVTASFECGNSRTLLFNDAGDNVSKSAEAIIKAGMHTGLLPSVNKNKNALSDAGYYQYLCGETKFVVDCGKIGPDYMPGHGHCDCLSYELFYKGKPLVVNSGTFQYQDVKRSYFRSTKAHNTFMINEVEQSQCWGEHRVAKRIKNIKATQTSDKFIGECTFWNGKKAKRTIEFDDNSIKIIDEEVSNNQDEIISIIHFAPEFSLTEICDKNYEVKYLNEKCVAYIEILSGNGTRVDKNQNKYFYAHDFGQCTEIEVLEVTSDRASCVQYKIEWRE